MRRWTPWCAASRRLESKRLAHAPLSTPKRCHSKDGGCRRTRGASAVCPPPGSSPDKRRRNSGFVARSKCAGGQRRSRCFADSRRRHRRPYRTRPARQLLKIRLPARLGAPPTCIHTLMHVKQPRGGGGFLLRIPWRQSAPPAAHRPGGGTAESRRADGGRPFCGCVCHSPIRANIYRYGLGAARGGAIVWRWRGFSFHRRK
jgi:hypothetical protein